MRFPAIEGSMEERNFDDTCIEFQKTVSLHLIRQRSILDAMTMYQDACSRVNRAIAKSVTSCGCLKIKAEKQELPADANLLEMSEYVRSHLEGHLCPSCRDIIEEEMGKSLFFLAALSTLTGINLHEIIKKESERVSTLGMYGLT